MRKAFFMIFPMFFYWMPAYAGVVINEVAWMGTSVSASDEWIELYSDSGQNLDGWTLQTEDGGMTLSLSGSVSPGGYFLIERTNDDTVPGIPADLIKTFGSGLANAGEILILKNASGAETDRVDGSGGWAIGGSNETKETLQRTVSGWATVLGTPKASNGYESAPAPQQTPTPEPVPEMTPAPAPTQAEIPAPVYTPASFPTPTPEPSQTSVRQVAETPTAVPAPLPSATPAQVQAASFPAAQSSPLYNSSQQPGSDAKVASPKSAKAKKTSVQKQIPEEQASQNIASVAEPSSAAGQPENAEYLWLAAGLAVGILAGAVFVFAKRYSP